MTNLYRHFDANGVLLYVGISLNAINRLCQHRCTSHWFDTIARVEIASFESRDKALRAEREAIISEKPKHNIVHAIHETPERTTERNASHSRATLLKRVVEFRPMYNVTQVATTLQIQASTARRLIESGEIGSVCVGERMTGRYGLRKVMRVTGWQLIEYIEHMEAAGRNLELVPAQR